MYTTRAFLYIRKIYKALRNPSTHSEKP